MTEANRIKPMKFESDETVVDSSEADWANNAWVVKTWAASRLIGLFWCDICALKGLMES